MVTERQKETGKGGVVRRIRYLPLETTMPEGGPGGLVEVTIRTIAAMLLCRPSERLNQRILGVMGRALALYPVALHAFVFMSNHWHALLTTPDGETLARFVQHVNSNVAKAIKEETGWTGRVWQRRAANIAVLDDDAAEDRLRYVLAHGVKEGLVERSEDWPGVNCVSALLGRERLVGRWATKKGRKRVVETYFIDLAPLPGWRVLREEQRLHRVRRMLAGIQRDAAAARGEAPALGRAAVLAQDPLDRPTRSKHGAAPPCHTTERHRRDAFKAGREHLCAAYAAARERRWRREHEAPAFPAGCFPSPPRFVAPIDPAVVAARRARVLAAHQRTRWQPTA